MDILIGVDAIDLHKTIKEVQDGPGEPIARRTPLGWTCVGSLEKNYPLKEHESLYHAQDYETLDALLRQFWELDSIGLADTDDQRSFTLIEKDAMRKVANTRRKVSRRYEVGIPWLSDSIDLENNKSLVLQRLESLERSLRHQPDAAERYKDVLESHEKKGYIKKLTGRDAFKRPKWFLPHFPVVREDRATTKVRIVFDSAAKIKGKSLNDMMHSGPKLQKILSMFLYDLDIILLLLLVIFLTCSYNLDWQWKIDPTIVFCEAIWKLIEDQRSLNFSGLSLVTSHLLISHKMFVDIMLKAMQKSSLKLQRLIIDSMYMDDVMDSVTDIPAAIKLRRDLTELFALVCLFNFLVCLFNELAGHLSIWLFVSCYCAFSSTYFISLFMS